MKKIIVLLAVTCATLNAQNFSGGFNFNLPWNDSTTQKFLPQFPIEKIPVNTFITIDAGGNFSLGGKKIKFWGTNSVADGAFPQKDKAAQIAGRMRKLGINLVRMHHLDNPWSAYSLLPGSFSTSRSIYQPNLDLLEYYISKLKETGIFINMNLNVARKFHAMDGVEGADSINNYGTDFAKGVTLFDPYLIMLEKEYAQQLLTHVNPYTGKALVNDPVMAMVETNNENSLYRFWKDDQLKPIPSGGKLINRHVHMLDSLFNEFLKNKYQNTQTLASSWNQGITPFGQNEQIKNGSFEQTIDYADWELEVHTQYSAQATLSRDNVNPYRDTYSAKVIVSQSSGTDWHIQFKYKTITVNKDSAYTITFAVRSDAAKNISVSLMNENSPWTWYGGMTAALTTNWKIFSFNVKAPETNIGHTRLSFSIGKSTGMYWFDSVSVTRAGVKGLMNGETIEAQNIRRIDYSECAGFTDQRVKDMSEFYLKLESDYFTDMKNYLHNTLGVKVPVVGTNWNVGAADMSAISVSDYIDNHAYWDHPQFPNIPWSSTDWFINNTPMVKSSYGGTIPDLFAGVPMVGRPYTISEYNHAYPNRYQSEALLFLTGYASFHGADGIMMFDYSGDRDGWDKDFINGYFDMQRNSVYMSLYPSCALAFRNGFIDVSKNPITINYSKQTIGLFPKTNGSDWRGSVGYDRHLALQHSVRTESYNSSSETDFSALPPPPTSPYRTDTDQIVYNTTDGTLTIASHKFNGAAGFLSALKNTRIGDLSIIDFNNGDFGTMTWVSLTNEKLLQSKRSLITLASKIQNTNMTWDGTQTVHNKWGQAPIQIYPLNVKVDLNIYADSIKIFPLDSKGTESAVSSFSIKPFMKNHFLVSLDQNQLKSLWFGVEAYGNGDPTSVNEENKLPTEFRLEQNYPNPFNPTTTIKFSIPTVETLHGASLHVSLKTYDLLGREVSTLVNETKSPGNYEVIFDASKLASGIYIYTISSEGYFLSKKMVLLK